MASWTEPKFYTEKAEQAAAVIQEKTRQAALNIGVPHEKVAEAEDNLAYAGNDYADSGFGNFANFNIELIRPFKRLSGSSFEEMKSEIVSSIALKAPNPTQAFILWNILCFWLGILDITFALLFGLNLFSLIIFGLNAASGYIFAYFFYHTFIVLRKKRYLICGFGMLCVYIAMMLMAASVSLINPFGFGFSVAKALANAILALHAWQLVQLAPEEETRGPFDRAAQRLRDML